ncbi:MAG: SGNH/GDSL hydrolase family protein [Lachnospiraceae bacterium]|nr:SGNH/GDSL hydrolase family protein [Lachnospiraceae bacterium]
MPGVVAPKDPTMKRKGFYIMRDKSVAGLPQPDGRGIQHLWMDCGRMVTAAKLVGNIEDSAILDMLQTTADFRKLVHSIGVTVEMDEHEEMVNFALQMYGKTDPYVSGTNIVVPIKADGMEMIIDLESWDWSDDDDVPGQIRFEFAKPEMMANVSVQLYLYDGYDVPEVEDENPVDFGSDAYKEMIKNAIVQTGNNARLKKAINKARAGEEITIAFIGGSITQGAGAVPINTECYAYKMFKGLCELTGRGLEDNIHYVKAGVGGTPSELGMIRYDKDVLRDGTVKPDIVVVEFAVNDAGDETGGECFDSLVRRILASDNEPAVILEFSVFSDDYNLQDRLAPVGVAYDLPMVSAKNTVTKQFYLKAGEGKVVSKNQYFYDIYHPTNVGHSIMADGLIHLLKTVDAMDMDEDMPDINTIAPAIGGAFQNVQRLDRKTNKVGAVIQPGSFDGTDTQLQYVEMNMDIIATPQFPDNWYYDGSKADALVPFSMDIECSTLLIVYKDSNSIDTGVAQVWVDGEKVLTIDPRLIGWTHCNPYICFREKECKTYHVEVRMEPGYEDKVFTILGFGYVK